MYRGRFCQHSGRCRSCERAIPTLREREKAERLALAAKYERTLAEGKRIFEAGEYVEALYQPGDPPDDPPDFDTPGRNRNA